MLFEICIGIVTIALGIYVSYKLTVWRNSVRSSKGKIMPGPPTEFPTGVDFSLYPMNKIHLRIEHYADTYAEDCQFFTGWKPNVIISSIEGLTDIASNFSGWELKPAALAFDRSHKGI